MSLDTLMPPANSQSTGVLSQQRVQEQVGYVVNLQASEGVVVTGDLMTGCLLAGISLSRPKILPSAKVTPGQVTLTVLLHLLLRVRQRLSCSITVLNKIMTSIL